MYTFLKLPLYVMYTNTQTNKHLQICCNINELYKAQVVYV